MTETEKTPLGEVLAILYRRIDEKQAYLEKANRFMTKNYTLFYRTEAENTYKATLELRQLESLVKDLATTITPRAYISDLCQLYRKKLHSWVDRPNTTPRGRVHRLDHEVVREGYKLSRELSKILFAQK